MSAPAAQTDPAASAVAISMEDASARLEAALARLEALVDTGPLQSDVFRARGAQDVAGPGAAASDAIGPLQEELDAAKIRARALEAAASQASDTLGRAMAEVRQLLGAGDGGPHDGDETGELDLDAGSVEDVRP